MKSSKILLFAASLLLFLMLTSCSSLDKQSEEKSSATDLSSDKASEEVAAAKPELPNTLPVQYQSPSYQVGEESKQELSKSKDVGMKVGATIKSTRGPQPLWDIMKRLAAIKGMNISWASDVDQKVLVDVDINASDDYNGAIANLLRQVDYFHEISGNTIVIKYKETRQFYISMPFVKSNYKTGTGGNVLGSDDESNNIDGTIELKSNDNEFDVWKSIEANLNSILDVWTTETITETAEKESTKAEVQSGTAEAQNKEKVVSEATRLRSSNKNVYIIDKPVGMVTVTAPRPLLDRVETYFKNLKRELYKQISIEAKIIEVKLTQNSSIGINWNEVLKDFSVDGVVEFGSKALGGQVYPYIFADEEGTDGTQSIDLDGDGVSDAHTKIQDPTRFVSKVAINPQNFTAFINALEEQGDTKVLSNPKISLMNGQPGLITVGRNVTYIDNIESDLDSETGIVTYTVNTERILSGIGMALTATILDDKEIILNLVPVTSELVEPIEYKDVGTLGATVGLPIVNVREMSTTVRVRNGEMLVIGGLISEIQETEGNFAPVVGKIPLFRYLFGYEEKVNQKRELIILLKPVII